MSEVKIKRKKEAMKMSEVKIKRTKGGDLRIKGLKILLKPHRFKANEGKKIEKRKKKMKYKITTGRERGEGEAPKKKLPEWSELEKIQNGTKMKRIDEHGRKAKKNILRTKKKSMVKSKISYKKKVTSKTSMADESKGAKKKDFTKMKVKRKITNKFKGDITKKIENNRKGTNKNEVKRKGNAEKGTKRKPLRKIGSNKVKSMGIAQNAEKGNQETQGVKTKSKVSENATITDCNSTESNGTDEEEKSGQSKPSSIDEVTNLKRDIRSTESKHFRTKREEAGPKIKIKITEIGGKNMVTFVIRKRTSDVDNGQFKTRVSGINAERKESFKPGPASYYDWGYYYEDLESDDGELDSTEPSTSKFNSEECGRPAFKHFGSRIVGGKPATKETWPWQVRLNICGILCGGTIINKYWIVTAAHCLPRIIRADCIHIWSDIDRISDIATSESFQASKIVAHAEYSEENYVFDIALIKSSRIFRFDARTSAVCLPTDPPPTGKTCYSTGYGLLKGNGSLADKLMEVPLPVMSDGECFGHWRSLYRKQIMMCAGGDRGKDTCMGDSGGPIVCKQGDQWLMHGITSFGNGDCSGVVPSVYTRTSYFIGWIRDNLDDDV